MSNILFLGTGNMGGAILNGLLQQPGAIAAQFGVYDPHAPAREAYAQQGCTAFTSVAEALAWCETVVVAVKPQIFKNVAPQWSEVLQQNSLRPLIVSIMAGISVAKLRQSFPTASAVVRTMPNLPMTVAQGVVTIAGDDVPPAVLETTQALFAPVAQSFVIPESMMDAATALAGSGPAFVFQFMDGLIQGAVKEGIPFDLAYQLALNTISGSAAMAAQSGKSPADLSAAVSSPGGTTIYGLHALASGAFAATLSNAITAAAERSRFLNS